MKMSVMYQGSSVSACTQGINTKVFSCLEKWRMNNCPVNLINVDSGLR